MWAAVGLCTLGALASLFAAEFLGDSLENATDTLHRAAIALGLLAGVLAAIEGTRWMLATSRGSVGVASTRGRMGRRAVRDRLTNRLRESGGLMNQRPRGAAELHNWISRVQGWHDATYAEIQQHVSPAQAAQFGNPQRRRRHRKFLRAVNEEHNDWLLRLDEWRDRLRDVIGRL